MGLIYSCEKCGHRQVVDMRVRLYEGPSGMRPIIRVGWCRSCSRVVQVEYVPSLKELKDEERLIKKRAPWRTQRFTNEIDRELAGVIISEYIAWRRRRKSRSRCFECAGHDLSLPNEEYGSIDCPICGNEMCANMSIEAGTHRYDPDVYSTEGKLIRKGKGLVSCFSTWSVPASDKRSGRWKKV